MKKWASFAVLIAIIAPAINALGRSPCPNLFQYVSEKPGEWKGDLTLNSVSQLHGVWIRLIFDTSSVQLEVDNDFGTISTTDHLEYLLKNREYVLKAEAPTKIRITVKYEGDKAPKLVGFRLNARTVCPEHGGEFSWVEGTGGQSSNEYFLGDLNNKDFLSTRPVPGSVSSCGTVPLFPGVVAAKKSVEGQFPWHASVYLIKGNENKKICSATLISPNHLVTAAHCVSPKNAETPLHPDVLKISLGEHFANAENKGLQDSHVIQVTVHPGYNAVNLENDVAIIKLDKAITITDYVRPVCLWEESPDVSTVLRRDGSVSGFGFDTEGRFSDRLTHTKLNVASRDVCLNTKPELATFLTDKSLCAGYEKGNTICVGESGSGMVFLKQGPKPVWQLRAIVALGAGLQNKLICDQSNFIIMTDLAKHLKWIEASLL